VFLLLNSLGKTSTKATLCVEPSKYLSAFLITSSSEKVKLIYLLRNGSYFSFPEILETLDCVSTFGSVASVENEFGMCYKEVKN